MTETGPPALDVSSEALEWDTLARSAANRTDEAEADEELLQLLTFELDGAAYAIPVDRVREVVRMRPVTPIPRVSKNVRGVISLRGEIIQVVDLRRRLSLEPIEPTRRTRIIVAHHSDGQLAAMLVDDVREVMRVAADTIRPVTASDSGAIEALCARGDEFVSIIELDRVLTFDA